MTREQSKELRRVKRNYDSRHKNDSKYEDGCKIKGKKTKRENKVI